MITDNLSSEGQILRRKWNIAEIIYYFIGNGFTEIDVKIKIRENSNSVIAIYKYNSIIDFATKLLSARTSYKSYQNHHKLTTFFFPETIRDKWLFTSFTIGLSQPPWPAYRNCNGTHTFYDSPACCCCCSTSNPKAIKTAISAEFYEWTHLPSCHSSSRRSSILVTVHSTNRSSHPSVTPRVTTMAPPMAVKGQFDTSFTIEP